jgi:hypothetical protein
MIGEDRKVAIEPYRDALKSQSSHKSPTAILVIIAFYAYVVGMGVIISKLDRQGGLRGDLKNDGNTIAWRNNTAWYRSR